MSVTLTVLDNIAAELVRRLTTLTNRGTEQTHVSEVVAPAQVNPWTPQHLQIVVQQGDGELVQTLASNPPVLEWSQPFLIMCHVIQDAGDRSPLDGLINRFVADVTKVVTQPQSTWHQFAGYANLAQFGSPVPINQDVLRGKVLPLTVIYRVSENNAYEVRA